MILPEQDETTPLTALGASREVRVAVADLERLATEYLLDCEYRGHQPHTVASNRTFLANFCWFLRHKCRGICGRQEIKQFLHYLQQEPGEGGRWGISRFNKPLRPITARTYHRCLATFFKWMVEEEILRASPMEKIKAPTVRSTLKEPLSEEQCEQCSKLPAPQPTATAMWPCCFSCSTPVAGLLRCVV
jgi:site-specific recombinase XerD